MKTAKKVVAKAQMTMDHSNYKSYQIMVCPSISTQLGIIFLCKLYILCAAFELSSGRIVTRVYVTTTGDKVYGFLPRESENGKI